MEDAIFDKGLKGQIVVLDGVNLLPNGPLSEYEQPAFFIISDIIFDSMESRSNEYMVYILKDTSGKESRVMTKDMGWWLVDINVWAKRILRFYSGKLSEKNKEIETINTKLDILKEVMVSQGTRVLTKKQAEELGIE